MRLKKNKGPHQKQFDQWLAQYKARVYESYFLAPRNLDIDIRECMESQASKPVILVIEDSADEWFILRWVLLEQFPEATLIWLSDANEILPKLNTGIQTEAELPQMILLDLYLPGLKTGLAVLQALKSHPLYQRIPVVVTSRSTDPDDIKEVYTYSANAYIVKPARPVEWKELLPMLRSLLEEENSTKNSAGNHKK
ncbi:response regulator [Spirosoma jeollabukense]